MFPVSLAHEVKYTGHDGDSVAGLAGAILVTGRHRDRVLLITAEVCHAAVAGGGVARMLQSVHTHSHDLVGFSNRRGAPGHQGAVVLAGGVGRHVSGWTRL